MVYRATHQTEARKAEVRSRILKAARGLIATGGFGAVQVTDVAHGAGIATGTIYRYFPSKPDLFAEVFRGAAQREVDQVAAIADGPGTPLARLRDAIRVFTARAVRGRRLAWSLIAEPVDPVIEAERLRFRRAYDAVFRRLIEDGMKAGEFVPQDAAVASASIVGALAEALVGPLAPDSALDEPAVARLSEAMSQFCVRAMTGRTDHADGDPLRDP